MSSYKEDAERAEQGYSDCEDALMEIAGENDILKKQNAQLRQELEEARGELKEVYVLLKSAQVMNGKLLNESIAKNAELKEAQERIVELENTRGKAKVLPVEDRPDLVLPEDGRDKRIEELEADNWNYKVALQRIELGEKGIIPTREIARNALQRKKDE